MSTPPSPGASPENIERPSSPVILYNPPTAFTLLRTAAINLVLPFINGLMLGFGELFAHEIAFRWGWGTQRVFPAHRITARSRAVGPGIEGRESKGFSAGRLDDLTSLE
ncbi:outer membrane protein TOM13-domain-containing protein [Pyronema omphalodes]|nr:outer membrane protein TOM13-domain-containing protein [Pyronema omphalodes]